MRYFYYTDDAGATVVIRSETPSEGWTPIPPNLEDAVFACVANDVPFRVAGEVLDLGVAKPRGAVARWDWAARAWVDTRSTDEVWLEVRSIRDGLLARSDWTQLPDVPLATKEAWTEYRQALRDVTLQTDPNNIVWPAAPV